VCYISWSAVRTVQDELERVLQQAAAAAAATIAVHATSDPQRVVKDLVYGASFTVTGLLVVSVCMHTVCSTILLSNRACNNSVLSNSTSANRSSCTLWQFLINRC
jgi:hypothetical protein